jgi:hypothetical protein
MRTCPKSRAPVVRNVTFIKIVVGLFLVAACGGVLEPVAADLFAGLKNHYDSTLLVTTAAAIIGSLIGVALIASPVLRSAKRNPPSSA